MKVGDILKLKKDDSSWKIFKLDSYIHLISFDYFGELYNIGKDADTLGNYAYTRKSRNNIVDEVTLNISLESNEGFIERYFYTQRSLRKLKLDRIRRNKRFGIFSKWL